MSTDTRGRIVLFDTTAQLRDSVISPAAPFLVRMRIKELRPENNPAVLKCVRVSANGTEGKRFYIVARNLGGNVNADIYATIPQGGTGVQHTGQAVQWMQAAFPGLLYGYQQSDYAPGDLRVKLVPCKGPTDKTPLQTPAPAAGVPYDAVECVISFPMNKAPPCYSGEKDQVLAYQSFVLTGGATMTTLDVLYNPPLLPWPKRRFEVIQNNGGQWISDFLRAGHPAEDELNPP